MEDVLKRSLSASDAVLHMKDDISDIKETTTEIKNSLVVITTNQKLLKQQIIGLWAVLSVMISAMGFGLSIFWKPLVKLLSLSF